MVELTDNGDILLQFGKGAQVGGNEDAALCIELGIERIGKIIALDAPCFLVIAQCADLVLKAFPFRFRIDRQTAIQTLGDREVLAELLAQLGRHCQTPFGIYGMLVFALHRSPPSFPRGGNRDTLPHISPPYFYYSGTAVRLQDIFCIIARNIRPIFLQFL